MTQTVQRLSISLPAELLRYAAQYKHIHQLESRSEVIARALEALRTLERIEGYKQMAQDYRTKPDPLMDSGISDGLEPSTEDNW